MSQETLTALAGAVDGLLYSTESDEPFEVVIWPAKPGRRFPETVLELLGYDAAMPVEVGSPESFFKGLTTEQSWHGEEEKADVRRYRELLKTLEKHLSELQVVRVGKIKRDVLVVGKTGDGKWAGIKTKAVET